MIYVTYFLPAVLREYLKVYENLLHSQPCLMDYVLGVALSHGAVIESVLGSREVYGPRSDRVLQFSNYTFDFSVWVSNSHMHIHG